MLFQKNTPIRQKLMMVIMLTSGAALLLMCLAFFTYEVLTFRQATVRQLSTLGKIIAANSTAALAFDNHDDANETLAALKAEQHIVSASLYDKDGKLFAQYPPIRPSPLFRSCRKMMVIISNKAICWNFCPSCRETGIWARST